MKKVILTLLLMFATMFTWAQSKIVKVTVEPAEASIYINNNFIGNGYAEFTRPKRSQVVVIRCEAPDYKTVTSKFYGTDRRQAVSITLIADGYYRSSAASGIVNKYFNVDVSPENYSVDVDGKRDVSKAWKLINQILLSYFDEIAVTDYSAGYIQTPWQYKSFAMSEMQIRNRVTIRDASTDEIVRFQIKIDSETAGALAARHGEFTTVDRIPKDFEPLINELQTRIGKMSSL